LHPENKRKVAFNLTDNQVSTKGDAGEEKKKNGIKFISGTQDPVHAARPLDGFDGVVEEGLPSSDGRDDRLVTAGFEGDDACVDLLPLALPGDAVDPRGTGLTRPPGLIRPGLVLLGLTPRILAPVVLIGAGLDAVKDMDVAQGLDVLLALALTGGSICEGDEVLLADADDDDVPDEAELEMIGGFLSLIRDETELLVEEVDAMDEVDPLALVLVMTFDRSAELVADSKYLSPNVF